MWHGECFDLHRRNVGAPGILLCAEGGDRIGAVAGSKNEGLLQEGEEDGEDEAGEGDEVVPVDGLSLEDE